jgi:uncharacterized membrane protein (UPF0127 family)
MKGKYMVVLAIIVFILVVCGTVYLWYGFFFGTVNPTLTETTLTIHGHTWTVELARTMLEQTRGLSGRPSLGTDQGMLFVFGAPSIQYFWMIGMKFPLDMIWISDDKVVGFAQNDPAPPLGTPTSSLAIYASPDGTDKVLEVNAGAVAKYGIEVGDAVQGNF